MTRTLADTGLTAEQKDYIRRLKVLFFGPYKAGKTIIAHGMPNTRTLDFDDGMQSIEWAVKEGLIEKELWEMPFATILPENIRDRTLLERAMAQINEWIEEEDIPPDEWEDYCKNDLGLKHAYPQFWDTLIVDTMSGFNEGAINQAMYEMHGYGLSQSWKKWGSVGNLKVRPSNLQDYGGAAGLTIQFVTELKKLPKNVIIITHEYPNTDDQGSLLSIEPKLWGQARSGVPSMLDEVWYASVSGTRDNPQFRIQTKPDSLRKCGSRLGCLDAMEVGDFYALREKVATYYGVDEEWLWSAAHGSAEVAAEEEKELARMKKGGTMI